MSFLAQATLIFMIHEIKAAGATEDAVIFSEAHLLDPCT